MLINYRIKVKKSSINNSPRLFDVTADGRIEAARKAAMTICASPFDAPDYWLCEWDFEVKRLGFFLWASNVYSVKHSRLCLISFEFEITPLIYSGYLRELRNEF